MYIKGSRPVTRRSSDRIIATPGSDLDRDALPTLLGDWQVRLGARDTAPASIDSYLSIGHAFCDFLARNGWARHVRDITRD